METVLAFSRPDNSFIRKSLKVTNRVRTSKFSFLLNIILKNNALIYTTEIRLKASKNLYLTPVTLK